MDLSYMTAPEVATHLRTTVGTLHQWRHRKCGPPAIKVGRRLLYRRTDVERWLAQLEQAA